MSNLMGSMREALRLTRAGDLGSATARIRSALRGTNTVAETAPVDAAAAAEVPVPARSDHVTAYTLPPLNFPRATSTVEVKRPGERKSKAGRGERMLAGTFSNAAGKRAFKLFVPSGHTDSPMPLVVMLHGCTQNAEDFAAGTRMNELAERAGFLVLYPEQAGNANGNRCWNWFRFEDQQRESGEPSLIADMTQQIAQSYSVDAQRIYVAGLSAGAAMAVVLGETYPDLYAAVGVHSGLSYAAAHDVPSALAAMKGREIRVARKASIPSSPPNAPAVPLVVFHGDRDSTVVPSNSEKLIAQALAKVATSQAPLTQTQEQHNAAQANHHAYTHTVYRDVRGRSVVEHWQIHGSAHAWSGGSSAGSHTDPRGPDASASMIRFFLEHPRRS
jgi:poly(hydroxyalkanoate) depolymerase family esterase